MSDQEQEQHGRRRASSNGADEHGEGSKARRLHDDEPMDEPRAKVPKNDGSIEGGDNDGAPSGAQDTGDERGNRERQREQLEILCTRPTDLETKKGNSGTPVDLTANYFRLSTKSGWNIFQYHVDFEPKIELTRLRKGLLSEHEKLFGGNLYDGTKLYTCKRMEHDKTVLDVKSNRGDKFQITIKYVGVISMTEWQSLQVLNLILRRAMRGLKLQLVGRNFFDPYAKIDLREHRMQLWPGYQTSIRQHEGDILLCSELTHKVMRTQTVYDIYTQCKQGRGNFEEDFSKEVLGTTVLTGYNNQTYRINSIDFKQNPSSTFEKKGEAISYVEYYQTKYNITIRDLRQPLLVSDGKSATGKKDTSKTVLLIPELCRATGLTDSMRNDFQLMRAMADHTRMNPDRRTDRLRKFNERLQKTPESIQVLKDWNMALDSNLVRLSGRVIEPQRIVFSDHNKVSAGENADWTRFFRDNGLFTSPTRGLNRWAVIAVNKHSRELQNFVDALKRTAGGMQFQISNPREHLIYDDRNHSYLQAIEDAARDDPQIIFCLVPNNNAERYSSIKKRGCLDKAVPTQVVTMKSAGNQRGLLSIATKVAIQINCKLGYTPWMVDIPLSGLMTVGYDVSKSAKDRSKSFGALVATMDLKCNGTFYSTVSECSSQDVLANNLWPMMTKALRQYRREHDKLPTRIIFYRDGVSEGSLKQIYQYEVQDFVKKLNQEYEKAGVKAPMIAYILVTKSINTRFFANGRNPRAGTVVDDVVTLPERYDFYLVSQSVRQGTVAPTSYNVLFSNIRLSPDQIQQLTYKMCHLYYNWSGTTRVPAVCQYAKKLASLVGTNIFSPPSATLEKKLFYL